MEDKGHLRCDHCGGSRHTKEGCFKIIGYPEWWEDHKKRKAATRVTFSQTGGKAHLTQASSGDTSPQFPHTNGAKLAPGDSDGTGPWIPCHMTPLTLFLLLPPTALISKQLMANVMLRPGRSMDVVLNEEAYTMWMRRLNTVKLCLLMGLLNINSGCGIGG
uniref:Uncharacterized protein n=1 Tax=Chenopodium quinoa TaxID=63459 RepID=A0A803MSM8_CHEQI